MPPAIQVELIASLWLGIVVAIGVEARAKFRAPSLTLPVGLDVGRHVFQAIAGLEWVVFGILGLISTLSMEPRTTWLLIGGLAAILAAQNAWLRPGLNRRAAAVIDGHPMPASPLHKIYIVAEALKAILLIALVISASSSRGL